MAFVGDGPGQFPVHVQLAGDAVLPTVYAVSVVLFAAFAGGDHR